MNTGSSFQFGGKPLIATPQLPPQAPPQQPPQAPSQQTPKAPDNKGLFSIKNLNAPVKLNDDLWLFRENLDVKKF